MLLQCFTHKPNSQRDRDSRDERAHGSNPSIYGHILEIARNLSRTATPSRRIFLQLYEPPMTWHMKIAPTVHDYHGNLDISQTRPNVEELSRVYDRNSGETRTVAQLILFTQEKVSRIFTAVLRHEPGESSYHKLLPRKRDGSTCLRHVFEASPKLWNLRAHAHPSWIHPRSEHPSHSSMKMNRMPLYGSKAKAHGSVLNKKVKETYVRATHGQTDRTSFPT